MMLVVVIVVRGLYPGLMFVVHCVFVSYSSLFILRSSLSSPPSFCLRPPTFSITLLFSFFILFFHRSSFLIPQSSCLTIIHMKRYRQCSGGGGPSTCPRTKEKPPLHHLPMGCTGDLRATQTTVPRPARVYADAERRARGGV